MQLRTRTWFFISIACFVAAAILWRLAESRRQEQNALPVGPSNVENTTPFRLPSGALGPQVTLLSSGAKIGLPVDGIGLTRPADPGPYRLKNTLQTIDELVRNDRAVLLNNAFIDTGVGSEIPIPGHLRNAEAPENFLVQSRGAITRQFQDRIEQAGGRVVSYFPNNAFLVTIGPEAVNALSDDPAVQSVIAWEPYFKFDQELLPMAVNRQALPEDQRLNLLLFPETAAAAREAIAGLGAEVLMEGRTPFGPSMVVEAPPGSLVALAQVQGVQGIEKYHPRVLLNDLARARVGVAPDATVAKEENHLGLTGEGIPVNINDSGIDSGHPDLQGRVFPGDPIDLTPLSDVVGHGTHVAGTIASTGANSPDSDTVPGSPAMPDFRGMAPDADLYILPVDLQTGPLISDAYLQERAAERNYVDEDRDSPIVSNNSWGYTGAYTYSMSSASYDQAVRDALPEMEGQQPIIYVFAAGNDGAGNDNGLEGTPGTIVSPGNAKNVITVGAVETLREIDVEIVVTNSSGEVSTNAPFLGGTDSDNQVASFSSRGNVGPGTEGPIGRIKPDVVAPGTYVISTRSSLWNDPTGASSAEINFIRNQPIVPDELRRYSLFFPADTVAASVQLLPNETTTDAINFSLPIYGRYGGVPTVDDFLAFNRIDLPGDLVLNTPGDFRYSVGNDGGQATSFDIQTVIVRTNSNDALYDELKVLNDALAPHYRYSSGTSMAAPVVTGTVALIQQYLEEQGFDYSPALVKALLINGARSVNPIYNFATQRTINHQGWGLINLTNSLPATPFSDPSAGAVKFINQSTNMALATGESRTWRVSLSEEAQNSEFRVSLVWTDPPGNPNASIKLVNDLDLIVSRTSTDTEGVETTDVFLGNNFPQGSDFSIQTGLNATLTNDVVNNVENVFLGTPEGRDFLVTVRGTRVNVNAVTADPDDIAQDFALVISTGSQSISNAITLTEVQPPTEDENAFYDYGPTVVTNGFPILDQHVGANSPLNGGQTGLTNQWRFYTFTNVFGASTNDEVEITGGPFVAFATFIPPNLSSPSRNIEADIDLFVTRNDPALLTLDPATVSGAFQSTNSGGTEVVAFEDSTDGEVFYVGVKAEDQQSAEYGLVALSSDEPFEELVDGQLVIRGRPVSIAVEDGSPESAPEAFIFGVGISETLINRATVEMRIAHENIGDLVGKLSHNGRSVVLNNHTVFDAANGAFTNNIVYDDSLSGELIDLGIRSSDGPGSLINFIGDTSSGLWVMAMIDNAGGNQGRYGPVNILVEPAEDLLGVIIATVQPNSYEYFFTDVPPEASKLTVYVQDIDPPLPLELMIKREDLPTLDDNDKQVTISPSGGELVLTEADDPPLNPGRYFVGVFNPNDVAVTFTIGALLELDISPDGLDKYFADEEVPLTDDALTVSTINVPEDLRIADLRVGVRIDHPRVSDLALRLVSPQGTTVLLSENRGLETAQDYGVSVGGTNHSYATFTINTNLSPEIMKYAVPPFRVPNSALMLTNTLLLQNGFEDAVLKDPASPVNIYTNTEMVSGWTVGFDANSAISILTDGTAYEGTNYSVLGAENYLGGRVFGSIMQSFNTLDGAEYNISFRHRGSATQVLTNGSLAAFVDTMGDDWEDASVKVRAQSDMTNFELRSLRNRFSEVDDVRIEEIAVLPDAYYFPEESLELLVGERALGTWQLQVYDRRAGPDSVAVTPAILNWKLEIDYANPTVGAIELEPGEIYSGTLTNGGPAYFKIQVPLSATAATNIVFSPGDVILAGDKRGLPGFDPLLDQYYVDNFGAGAGEFLLITTTSPPTAVLEPGNVYYLGIKNFDETEINDFLLAVFFDQLDPVLPSVVELQSGVTVTDTVPAGPTMDYYEFVSSPESVRSQILLEPANGNVDLYIRKEVLNDPAPLPTINNFDFESVETLTTPDEIIISIDASDPNAEFPLEPGTYYVGVLNRDGIDVTYDITWTETLAPVTELQDGVGQLGNNITRTYDYYYIDVPPDAIRADFEVLGPTGEVYLDLKKGQIPFYPTATGFPFIADYTDFEPPGAVDRLITVRNTSGPVPLSPGRWYLGVFNNSGGPVTYTVRATLYYANIIDLTSGVPEFGTLGWTDPEEVPMDFYRYEVVSPVAESALFELFDFVGAHDLDLLMTFGLANGLPTDQNFDYASTNPIGQREVINVVPNSLPVQLQPGDWYLTVIHRGPGVTADTDVDYTIQATETVPVVTPLTNNVPVTATNPTLNQAQYYSFDVSAGAIELQFETSAQTGDVDIYVRNLAPLPSDKNFDYASENAGTAGELIVVNPTSPVPLGPGTWYLSVVSRENAPVTYTVLARETLGNVAMPLTSGVPEVDVLNANPGEADYYVFNVSTNAVRAEFRTYNPDGPIDIYLKQGLPLPGVALSDYESVTPGIGDNLIIVRDTDPVPLAPGDWYVAVVKEIPADVVTYSIVAEEFFATPPFDPNAPQFPEIIPDPANNQLCLRWQAQIGRFYSIQHKDTLDQEWAEVAVVQADENPETFCLPLGPTIGFYRVVPLDDVQPPPGEGTPVIPLVIPDIANNLICLQWDAEVGRFYRIETKADLDDPNWTEIDTLQALQSPEEYCIDASGGVGFYRVVPLGNTPPMPDVEDPIFPATSIDLTSSQICLTWAAEIGRFYRIERREDLTDSTWDVVATIEASANPQQYCLPLTPVIGFYRVIPLDEVAIFQGEGDPITPVGIPDAANNLYCLEWTAQIGRYYRIETKAAPTDPEWTVVTTVQALREIEQYCLDASGGVGFYQIIPLGDDLAPPVNDPLVPLVVPDFANDQICLEWDAVIGNWYRVERRTSITDSVWTEVATVQADQSPFRYCLDLGNSVGFYRIIPLGADYTPSNGPGEIVIIQNEVVGNKLVFSWSSMAGRSYTLQGMRNLAIAQWEDVETIIATGPITGTEVQLLTAYSIFRVLAFGVEDSQPVGTLDASFAPTNVNGNQVWAVATQSDGKILIGGDFTSVNGVARDRIARLNADGTVDASFDAGAFTATQPGLIVNVIEVLPDGKILVGGKFATVAGVTSRGLVRLNSDGSVDQTFGSNGVQSLTSNEGEIFAIALQSDGKILIGGSFAFANQQGRQNLARLNANGALDTSFSPMLSVNGAVRDIVVQPNGRILIGGDFTQVNASLLSGVARLNADGSIDNAFTPGNGARYNNGTSAFLVSSMALQANGKIVIAGRFDEFAGQSRAGITRLNSNGTLDLAFDTGVGPMFSAPLDIVYSVALQSDGKILLGGVFDQFDGTMRNKVARLNIDGSLDGSFSAALSGAPAVDARVHNLHLQSDNKLIAVGVGVTTGAGVVRFDVE